MFFLPNEFGRKPAIIVSLIGQIIGGCLIVWGTTINQKSLGFLFEGVFHLKNPISYLHCTELLPSEHMEMAVTLMQFFDTSSIVISCFFFLYVDNYSNHFLMYIHILGVTASILFMLFIPESPRHLFMKDPKSKEGIKVLNYIAWFNGSKFRVPDDAEMDNIHQVIKDTNVLNNTAQTTLRQQLNDTI